VCVGHTCHEVYILRHGSFRRIPDLVIWPGLNMPLIYLFIYLFILCYYNILIVFAYFFFVDRKS
jgi:alkyldihydroxyacetonephosphate synthase